MFFRLAFLFWCGSGFALSRVFFFFEAPSCVLPSTFNSGKKIRCLTFGPFKANFQARDRGARVLWLHCNVKRM